MDGGCCEEQEGGRGYQLECEKKEVVGCGKEKALWVLGYLREGGALAP